MESKLGELQHDAQLKASDVPLGLILRPGVFNITGLNDGVECMFIKFADDAKLFGVVGAPDGCAAIHKGINRLEK